MSWLILFVAGLFEIVWAIGLKYTDGFTRLLPSAITLIAAAISFGLLGLAMKTLPVGTAYSVWVGIGAAGTVLMGIVLFNEPVNALRIGSVVLIVLGYPPGPAQTHQETAAQADKVVPPNRAEHTPMASIMTNKPDLSEN